MTEQVSAHKYEILVTLDEIELKIMAIVQQDISGGPVEINTSKFAPSLVKKY